MDFQITFLFIAQLQKKSDPHNPQNKSLNYLGV